MGGSAPDRPGRDAQYLVVIYSLSQSDDTPIPTGRIARELDRSPAAATEMIQRLARRGLVDHEPYRGVSLTETGRERARDLYETHRTLCRFFRDVLDLDGYEREALALAGIIDPDIAARLRCTLLRPARSG